MFKRKEERVKGKWENTVREISSGKGEMERQKR